MMLRGQPSKRLRKGSGGPRVTGEAFKALYGAPKGLGAMSKGQGPGSKSRNRVLKYMRKVCAQKPMKPAESLRFRVLDTPMFPLP